MHHASFQIHRASLSEIAIIKSAIPEVSRGFNELLWSAASQLVTESNRQMLTNDSTAGQIDQLANLEHLCDVPD